MNLLLSAWQLSGSEADEQISRQYAAIRRRAQEEITFIQIAAERTLVICGESVQILPIGYDITANAYFRHSIPTPDEMENAIMAVEDWVMPVRSGIADGSTLVAADNQLREIALIAGVAEQPLMILSLEAMERTFDRLAAVIMGRPALREGIPESSSFATRLLILREFMHHLAFEDIRLVLPDSGALAS